MAFFLIFFLYMPCRCFVVFIKSFQRFLSFESSIFADTSISIKSFFTRSIHLCLGLPHSIFPTGLLVKTQLMRSYFALYTCPAHSVFLDIRKYWMFCLLNSFPISEFFHCSYSLLFRFFVGPYILLRTFLSTPSSKV